MFGIKDNETDIEKIKNKILDNSNQIQLLVEELKKHRQKEHDLALKISNIASDTLDYDKLYKDLVSIKDEEGRFLLADDDDVSDPRLKDCAIKTLSELDEEFNKGQTEFKIDEEKVENLEKQEITLEKELNETTRQIIEIEEKIKSLEEKNSILTKKLETDLEG